MFRSLAGSLTFLSSLSSLSFRASSSFCAQMFATFLTFVPLIIALPSLALLPFILFIFVPCFLPFLSLLAFHRRNRPLATCQAKKIKYVRVANRRLWWVRRAYSVVSDVLTGLVLAPPSPLLQGPLPSFRALPSMKSVPTCLTFQFVLMFLITCRSSVLS